jgi:hypothetical protein
VVLLVGPIRSTTACGHGRTCSGEGLRSRTPNRKYSSIITLSAVFLALQSSLFLSPTYAQNSTTSEYAVKANIVRSIMSFVEWPTEVLSEDGAEDLTICVLGRDPFGGELELAIEGQTVGERAITKHAARRITSIGFCHLLFISESEGDRLPQILPVLEGLHVLTISDIEGFAEHGGMIGIEVVDSKNRLVVNRTVLARSELKLSSRLLRLARLVDDGLPASEP